MHPDNNPRPIWSGIFFGLYDPFQPSSLHTVDRAVLNGLRNMLSL